MSARILDGRAVAASLKDELRAEVAAASGVGALAIVRGGGDEASEVYARRLEALCSELGVETRTVEVSAGDALARVEELNGDRSVGGILVQLPLPEGADDVAVAAAVDPAKDVDGVNPVNAGRLYLGLPALAPATPLAVMELLRRHEVELRGRRAVVVGRSNITGKPAALLLLAEHATVTVCHSRTADLGAVVREGEIVVAAVGVPGLVTAEMVSPGAVVVDVGTNWDEGAGQLVGDVAYDEVAEVAGAISPVPGGVGPLTNLMLVRNLLRAAAAAAGR
ncbi:MAG TPA: bifunctional 5,10-methylenetetrahydrofolate dehydrogenase/5,10-methenyltetrahydrofolate cyclohydrolase [Thermoleophilaceae bacterium]|nr:bifunctional 5,10-methylenetetrahydrofolate dehydrogenase/5,10-methenyltetrahydrofolate cyclohydrolase [Thermoleophilaceae bacterium]